jgi:sRNA-binding carbon storage regulator CsrA
MPLFVNLLPGDALDMDNGRIKLTVAEKSGRRIRLRIDAAREIPVHKTESRERQEPNRSRDHPHP